MMKELDLNQNQNKDLRQEHQEHKMEPDSFTLFSCAPVSVLFRLVWFGLVWFWFRLVSGNNDCNLRKSEVHSKCNQGGVKWARS